MFMPTNAGEMQKLKKIIFEYAEPTKDAKYILGYKIKDNSPKEAYEAYEAYLVLFEESCKEQEEFSKSNPFE